jgi:hypothetical protein
VRGTNGDDQHHIALRPRRRPTLPPRIVPALRHPEHETHRRDWSDGLIRAHEHEDSGGIVPDSRANQAARSFVVNASGRSPRSARSGNPQLRRVCSDGTNSFAGAYGLRPARTRAMICSRSAAGQAAERRGLRDSSSHTEMEAPPKRGKFKFTARLNVRLQYLQPNSEHVARFGCR